MTHIVGHRWQDIQRAQRGGKLAARVDTSKPGDYGSDPIGPDRFRMIPSGDIVDTAERARRLAPRVAP